jgi:predicted nucleic acid-binding protein
MIAALLDINVVLDVFLARLSWVTDSAAVLAANQRGEIVGHLSAASISTISYVVRRNADLAKALGVVTECLASYDMAVVVDRLLFHSSLPGLKKGEQGRAFRFTTHEPAIQALRPQSPRQLVSQ